MREDLFCFLVRECDERSQVVEGNIEWLDLQSAKDHESSALGVDVVAEEEGGSLLFEEVRCALGEGSVVSEGCTGEEESVESTNFKLGKRN